MKKLFFTAIALVAFSSASIANTISDEEVIKENEACSILLKPDYWGCAAIAQEVYDEISALGDEAGAMLEADAAFDDCMGNSPCHPPYRC